MIETIFAGIYDSDGGFRWFPVKLWAILSEGAPLLNFYAAFGVGTIYKYHIIKLTAVVNGSLIQQINLTML